MMRRSLKWVLRDREPEEVLKDGSDVVTDLGAEFWICSEYCG